MHSSSVLELQRFDPFVPARGRLVVFGDAAAASAVRGTLPVGIGRVGEAAAYINPRSRCALAWPAIAAAVHNDVISALQVPSSISSVVVGADAVVAVPFAAA